MKDASTTTPARDQTSSTSGGHRYTAQVANEIEVRWQQNWKKHDTFRAMNPGDDGFDAAKPKYYVLDMFPYPSGAGLHVGHPEGYTATDIVARFKRHQGFNVLHPMGWDAFGLPAEQYAIQTGVHPAETTRRSIDTFRSQLQRFGFSYDWSREFATTDPEYCRWTQWIWLKAYDAWYDAEQQKARPIDALPIPDGLSDSERRTYIDDRRLAYLAEQTVNWCPKLGTALANEEVIDGKSERGGYPVYRKPLRQWMFRITAYADRLLKDLDLIDWPDSTRAMQTQWIGRSVGAEIRFPIVSGTPALRAGSGIAGTPALRAGSAILNAVDAIDLTDQYLLQVTSFVPRDPFPKGESSPNDLHLNRRNLPHIQLRDATYFVTWNTQQGIILSEQERSIVLDALKHWDDERCRTYAACVMPDHVHWVVRPFENFDLDELASGIKRFTARQINEVRGERGSVWRPEEFDHVVRDEYRLSKFIAYVAMNPLRAKLAQRAADYLWTFVHDDVRWREDQSPLQFIDALFGRMHSADYGSESRGTRELRVFTTRPDTIFGATFMVIAPEHPLVNDILAHPQPGTDINVLRAYVEAARNRSDVDRQIETKEKTGVFTGAYCMNPATKQCIPIWVADYVLMSYGTGAIMAVPGQDQRDWDFAKAFSLPIVRTVQPSDDFEGDAYTGEGSAINSANDEVSLNGLDIGDAKRTIIDWLEKKSIGSAKVNYKLRDWLFSRQRYWGEPFPIVFDEAGNHYPVSAAHLPVVLPDMKDYQPIESDDPQPLLAKATNWVQTTAGEAGVNPGLLAPDTPVKRETNTMPGWAGSCWYYLRFCDPRNDERFMSADAESYWMDSGGRTSAGVDLYIGGSEHAVLHLLYARFWHKILFDLGEVSTPEPFARVFHQGMITSFAYQRADKSLAPMDTVEEVREGEFIETATGERVTQVVAKMSKSLKNVINPDDVIRDYGADAFRLYEMYMGPLEATKPWNTRDIVGVFRFLQRVWRLVVDDETGAMTLTDTPDETIEKHLHRTIAKVESDIERLAFNTAIAAMIEFINDAYKSGGMTRDQLERFLIVLSPFAPHLAEELWSRLGHDVSIAYAGWPNYDDAMLTEDVIELPVQIQGKVRGRITVPADADQKSIEQAARNDERIQKLLEGKTVRKVIVVPGKIINIIAG